MKIIIEQTFLMDNTNEDPFWDALGPQVKDQCEVWVVDQITKHVENTIRKIGMRELTASIEDWIFFRNVIDR